MTVASATVSTHVAGKRRTYIHTVNQCGVTFLILSVMAVEATFRCSRRWELAMRKAFKTVVHAGPGRPYRHLKEEAAYK